MPPISTADPVAPASADRTVSATAGARTPPHLATLVLLAGGSVMAMNIFLPVLPLLAAEFGTSQAYASAIVTVFLATTGLAQLFIGPLSDRYGRRPILLITTATFCVATLICIFATSMEMLLFGRVLQASIAASIALSRAIVRDLYDRSKAASMIGYLTMAMAVIPMVSPAIGGFVGDAYGWQAPFVILLLVGLALLALIYVDLGETHAPSPSVGSSQIADYLALLRMPAIWGYVLTSSLASGAYFAFLGGAPFVASMVMDVSPTAMGWYFMCVAGGYIFGNFLSGRYSERIGIEPMMLGGGLVASVGVAISLGLMTAFEPHPAYLFWPMALVGMGNGMTLPNANAGAVSVRPELAGSASGLAGFMSIGGGAALAALTSALITEANEGLPLFVIMFLSSVAGSAIAWLMWRRTRLSGPEARV